MEKENSTNENVIKKRKRSSIKKNNEQDDNTKKKVHKKESSKKCSNIENDNNIKFENWNHCQIPKNLNLCDEPDFP